MDSQYTDILNLANEAIQRTKAILKFGSGNIIEDILRSESQSLGRSDYARELYQEAAGKHLTEIEKTFLRAAASKLAQGGNCHESASLVFADLTENTNNLKIQICRQKMLENVQDFHVFVQIVSDIHPTIIVDEWGSNRKAVVATEYNINKNEILIICEATTSNSNELISHSESVIKETTCYKDKERRIKRCRGNLRKIFKTNDNLQYLAEDKYIGKRMKRAYNDPGLM